MEGSRIVEVTGAVSGRYELKQLNEDGSIVLLPDTSIDAIMEQVGSTPASAQEFEAAFGDLPSGPA